MGRVKRFSVAVFAAASIASATLPVQATGASKAGVIQIPNVTNVADVGVTRLGAPCRDDPTLRGIDGYWIPVTGHVGHSITLRAAGSNSNFSDPEMFFYSSGCVQNDDYFGMAEDSINTPETGVIPAGASWGLAFFVVAPGPMGFSATY